MDAAGNLAQEAHVDAMRNEQRDTIARQANLVVVVLLRYC